MKSNNTENREFDPIEQAAAEWTVRIARGLSAEGQDEYMEWLASDSRHREAMSLYQWGWDELDRLAGLQINQPAIVDPDLLAPDRSILPERGLFAQWKYWISAFSAAAVILFSTALFFTLDNDSKLPVEPALELMTRIEQRVLDDGSKVELNRESAIEVDYSLAERRIKLISGEAIFDVEKDPDRPFIVNVGGVDVRAVGTIFSVKYLNSEVNVVVTEGKVGVTQNRFGTPAIESAPEAYLNVGQMGTIQLGSVKPEVQITNLNDLELEEINKWRPMLLEFDATPLREIVTEFNRRNPVKVVLEDPSIGALELSSSFWSDNVEGFVRLMVSSFGMEAEWRGSREIVLRKNDRDSI